MSAYDRVFFGDTQKVFFSFGECASVVCFLRFDDEESLSCFVSNFAFALEDEIGVAGSWCLVADSLRRRFDESKFSSLARKWAICFGGIVVAEVGLTSVVDAGRLTLAVGKRSFGILLH